MDITNDLLEPLDATERTRILGLPIGRRKPDWPRIAKVGAGAIIAVAGAVAVSKLSGRIRAAVGEVKDSAEDLVGDVGGTVSGTVGEVGDRVDGVNDAVEGLTDDDGALDAVTSIAGGEGSWLERARELVSGVLARGGDTDLKQRLIIHREIDVAVPRRVAYNQWTQFEDLPHIFRGVESAHRDDDEHSHWVAKVAFLRREWDATITEMVPDERIAWETDDGTEHRGVVTFHRLDDNLTRVQLEMEYHPQSLVEKVANLLRIDARRAGKDLDLFKHFLELRGEETGAWREEIPKQPSANGDPSGSGTDDTDAEASGDDTDTDEAADNGDADETPPRDEDGRFVDADAG